MLLLLMWVCRRSDRGRAGGVEVNIAIVENNTKYKACMQSHTECQVRYNPLSCDSRPIRSILTLRSPSTHRTCPSHFHHLAIQATDTAICSCVEPSSPLL